MAVAASVSVEGIEPIMERIGGLQERLADPTPAFRVTADLLELHVARVWETQGAHGGSPWAPLAPSTVTMRARRWGYYRLAPAGGASARSPILVWTGRSRASFRSGHPEHVRLISPSGLTWGSSVPWLKYHQSTRPRTRLPRRPMLAFRAFRDAFQLRELVFQPLRLWVQGVPEGAIRTVMLARQGGQPN